MVFAPDIGRQRLPTARVRAVEERRMVQAKGRGGVVRKLRQLRRLRRAAKLRSSAPGGRLARFGRAGGAARGAGRAAGRAIGTPIGLVVAAIIAVGAVAVRLGTGRPVEGLGADLNKAILGDADDKARARNTARETLKGDPDIARIVARDDGLNRQVKALLEEETRNNLLHERGASNIREELPVNNLFDMLVLRARDAIVGAWNAGGGDAKADKLANRLGSAVSGTGDEGSGGAKHGGR